MLTIFCDSKYIKAAKNIPESVLMIEYMEKTGKIEKTGDYNIYRIRKPVTTKEDEDWANMR